MLAEGQEPAPFAPNLIDGTPCSSRLLSPSRSHQVAIGADAAMYVHNPRDVQFQARDVVHQVDRVRTRGRQRRRTRTRYVGGSLNQQLLLGEVRHQQAFGVEMVSQEV